MNQPEMVQQIKSELGGSKVNIEVEDSDIEDFIDRALDKISSYINDTRYITKMANDVIDLSGENVEDIVRIYPNRQVTSNREQLDLFRARDYSNISDRMTMPYKVSQIEDYINRSFKFDHETGELYIDDYRGEITIEVISSPSTVSDLEDKKDKQWVFDYAKSLTKMALGRIRGKFRVNGSPYETDGDTLVQEGKSDKERLEQRLEDKGEGFFFVTR